MLKVVISILTLTLANTVLFAQKADGTVQSIIKTEEALQKGINKKGINKTFRKFSHKEGFTFSPTPISLQSFHNKKEIAGFHFLKRFPRYAMISKKGDLGFTTGPYQFSDGDVKDFGHYLSIWKNDFGKWALVLNIAIKHKNPNITEQVNEYFDPKDYQYPKLLGPKKYQMREDIVFSTDELFGKSLRKFKNKDLKEFYDPTVRLYFPKHIPALGKENSLKLISQQKLIFQHSEPTFVDRAISGDIAYTYGNATISGKEYSYVRVWKPNKEMKWNIILDVYNAK